MCGTHGNVSPVLHNNRIKNGYFPWFKGLCNWSIVLLAMISSAWLWCRDDHVIELVHGTHEKQTNWKFFLDYFATKTNRSDNCRYKRRGINEDGNVANYVETEQILSFGEHQMAFFQIRGSVPVYWSQPGFKYRPPPRIDRGNCDALTQIATDSPNDC